MAEKSLRQRTADTLDELVNNHGNTIIDGVVVKALVDHLTNKDGLKNTSVKDAEHILRTAEKLKP